MVSTDESSTIVATYLQISLIRKMETESSIADEITETKPEEKGYLARDEYTSERFKLELNNLPKYFGFGVS